MEETHSVVLAGIGGSGVVWAGTLLARAGVRKFPYVTRFPNFTTAMRGGPCECMVIFSTEEIASSLVAQGDALIVLENSQLLPWQDRVRPGGLLIVESTGLSGGVERRDVRVVPVPAVKIAASLGDLLSSNLIMLGVYLQLSGVMPPELVEAELAARFGVTETGIARAAETQSQLKLQLEAFHRGMELGEKAGVTL